MGPRPVLDTEVFSEGLVSLSQRGWWSLEPTVTLTVSAVPFLRVGLYSETPGMKPLVYEAPSVLPENSIVNCSTQIFLENGARMLQTFSASSSQMWL